MHSWRLYKSWDTKMKITKFLHSCLLIENEGITILIDPGSYTYQENVFPLSMIGKIDYIAITHEHSDHMDISFLKELIHKYPMAKIIANQSINMTLIEKGIVTETEIGQFIKTTPLPHEKMLSLLPPANWGFTIFDDLLHPGDSLQFLSSPRILALPVQAPWEIMVQAAEKGLSAKPKVIIPIHDYHWNNNARLGFYQMLTSYFAQYDIQFLHPETGVVMYV